MSFKVRLPFYHTLRKANKKLSLNNWVWHGRNNNWESILPAGQAKVIGGKNKGQPDGSEIIQSHRTMLPSDFNPSLLSVLTRGNIKISFNFSYRVFAATEVIMIIS
jgi:hypothetical protein